MLFAQCRASLNIGVSAQGIGAGEGASQGNIIVVPVFDGLIRNTTFRATLVVLLARLVLMHKLRNLSPVVPDLKPFTRRSPRACHRVGEIQPGGYRQAKQQDAQGSG